MTFGRTLPVLATHGGKFHCDDVFAYTALRLALDLGEVGEGHVLVRTRDSGQLGAADIVWDVGSIFDASANRFDHHQRGAPAREDGTPFSSAGLIWQVYGERAVAATLRGSGFEDLAGTIAADLDIDVVRRIDEIDNGVSVDGPVVRETLGLAALVGDFNPNWDHPAADGPGAGDAAFVAAASFVEGVLRRRIDEIRARLQAETIVLAAQRNGQDPRILVLDRGMPWKSAVFGHDLPVLFTVSPASNGNWMVDTVPPEPDSFAQRLSLPEAWAGLQDQDLADASGVPDAVFVHLRRFVGGARSRAGAVALARQALRVAAAPSSGEIFERG